MKKIVTLGLTLIATLTLIACGSSSSESKDESSSKTEKNSKVEKTDTSSEESSKESTNKFVGNTYETKDFKIEITQAKMIQPGQTGNEYGDKPVIAFWYKFTNITDKEKSAQNAWIFHFEAIQDNDPNKINKLEIGSLPDDRFLDSQLEDTKKGGTVEMAVAYELTDTKTPVTLEASEPFGDEAPAKKTFDLE